MRRKVASLSLPLDDLKLRIPPLAAAFAALSAALPVRAATPVISQDSPGTSQRPSHPPYSLAQGPGSMYERTEHHCVVALHLDTRGFT